MRLGKLHSRERIGRAYPTKIPTYSSPGMIVGSISSNVINSIYTPLIQRMATTSLEQYATDLVDYELALRELTGTSTTTTTTDADAQNNNETTTTTTTTTEEVQVDAGGTTTITTSIDNDNDDTSSSLPEPPPRPYYYSTVRIEEIKEMMDETSKEFSTLKNWRVWAKAAKFERHLDERYGILRPFITNHPEIEKFVRSLQRKYEMGYFSPIRQKPAPIGKSASIILLFMMHRNGVNWKIMILSSLFLLIGLQPWALVLIIILIHWLTERRKKRPIGKMKAYIETVPSYYHHPKEKERSITDMEQYKESFLRTPVGKPLGDVDEEELDMSQYDTMILGGGPSALYTAALLSRSGKKVLVLSPGEDASGCMTLSKCKDARFHQVPFDVGSNNVSRITRQQKLLVPALMTSTDYQGGVRFAQVGTEADGYAFEILVIPGMGGGSSSTTTTTDGIPFVVRASKEMLMEDATRFLGDGWPDSEGDGIGNSETGAYLAATSNTNASAGDYYLGKILDEKVTNLRSSSIKYGEASIRYTEPFLNQCFPLNPHLRSLFAGIGLKCENLKPSKTSMGAHITNICSSMNGEGMHYPVGGPRALAHALSHVVETSGGRVVTGIRIKELIFGKVEEDVPTDQKKKKKTSEEGQDDPVVEDRPHPRCLGVKLVDNDRIIQFSEEDAGSEGDQKSVLSMHGFVDTFIRYLPQAIRTEFKVPRGLPALSERRPVFKVLFALHGSADELNITGADLYRLPAAALPQDRTDPETGTFTFGEIGGYEKKKKRKKKDKNDNDSNNNDDDDDDEAVSEDAINKPEETSTTTTGGGGGKKKTFRRNKFDTGVSWLHISFPSAKDPSFEKRHGKITTCVVTIEADDDFVFGFDSKPKLYVIRNTNMEQQQQQQDTGGEFTRLLERVTKDLIHYYPQVQNKIVSSEIRGPLGNRGLSHNPERYAAKGIRVDTPYPGLYMGGSDLTVGDSFAGSIVAGWLAANAIMGYSALDFWFLEKNITSDLKQFMEEPYEGEDDDDDDDVAVPFEWKIVIPPKTNEETKNTNDKEEGAE